MPTRPINRQDAEHMGFRFLYDRPQLVAGRQLWMVERNGLDYFIQLAPAPAETEPVLLGIGFAQDWTAEQMRNDFDPNKPPQLPETVPAKPAAVQRSLFQD